MKCWKIDWELMKIIKNNVIDVLQTWFNRIGLQPIQRNGKTIGFSRK